MVQLVFIHGVATRSGPAYRAMVANRDLLFREILFEGVSLAITQPVWGDDVPAIDPEVFDTGKGVSSFSLTDGSVSTGMGAGLSGGASATPGRADVKDVAAADATLALDLIFAELVDNADGENRTITSEEIIQFRRATRAIEAGASSELVGGIRTDDELAFRLNSGDSFGISSRIADAVAGVRDRMRNVASTLAFNAVRGDLSPAVALFLGDVFIYLKDGAVRQKIRDLIRGAIIHAHQAKSPGEPLIVMGHSLGGVVLYDMLSSAESSGLPTDLEVDAFLTVGSQPGLFEAIGAFDFKRPSSCSKTPRPSCIRAWLNVFDPIDPFGFRADPVFEGVEDRAFNSVTGLLSAHTAYFRRPQFYARARTHLVEFGLL